MKHRRATPMYILRFLFRVQRIGVAQLASLLYLCNLETPRRGMDWTTRRVALEGKKVAAKLRLK